jgi:hypothetical protein
MDLQPSEAVAFPLAGNPVDGAKANIPALAS